MFQRDCPANTPRGDVSARHVLLATDAYTSHLLPQFADIIVPVKDRVCSLKPPPPQPAKGPLDNKHTFYFVSDLADRRDGYLIQKPPPGAELVHGGGRICAEGTDSAYGMTAPSTSQWHAILKAS